MSTATAQKILSDRIDRIEVSATMAITAEALKMKAQGIDLADFGAGEPHFSTTSCMSTATAQKNLSDRIDRIEVSATMAITAEALKMKAQGIDLADFGAGEPHFSTPQHIKDAAIKAIENNFTRLYSGGRCARSSQGGCGAAQGGILVPTTRWIECVFTTGGEAGAVQCDPGAGGPRR